MIVTIDIDDSLKPTLIQSFSEYGAYNETIENPEPKPQPQFAEPEEGQEASEFPINQAEIEAWASRIPNPISIEEHIKFWTLDRIKEIIINSSKTRYEQEVRGELETKLN